MVVTNTLLLIINQQDIVSSMDLNMISKDLEQC